MNQLKNNFSRPARDPPGALPLHQVEDGCSKMLWRPSGPWGGRTALLKTKDKTKGKNSLLLVVAQIEDDNSTCLLVKIKNSHILPTGQWYAPSAVINIAKM